MAINQEKIALCYKLLFGKDSDVLKNNLVNNSLSASNKYFLPLDLKKNQVEYIASQEQIKSILEKVKKSWSHLGKSKAHYSVLTDAKYLPENLEASAEVFWKTGVGEANRLVKILEKYGFPPTQQSTCVEYGSGVGRVTMGLAAKFQQVYGYDISGPHIEIAKKRAAEKKVQSVKFIQCSGDELPEIHKSDVFYSVIVLQHNPPPIMYEIINRALSALNPGGLAYFQVPTWKSGYSFELDKWLNTDHPLDMQMHVLPQEIIFEAISKNNCQVLEVREDDCTGGHDKNLSNTFIVKKLGP